MVNYMHSKPAASNPDSGTDSELQKQLQCGHQVVWFSIHPDKANKSNDKDVSHRIVASALEFEHWAEVVFKVQSFGAQY